MIPASNEILLIGDEYVSQVRTFGALGYSVGRICTLLHLSDKQKVALGLRMSLPDDVYYEAYQNGMAIGEYNIDAELTKQAERGDINAITLLEERKNERVELDLRKQLFGV
jgi:hypothetical protein